MSACVCIKSKAVAPTNRSKGRNNNARLKKWCANTSLSRSLYALAGRTAYCEKRTQINLLPSTETWRKLARHLKQPLSPLSRPKLAICEKKYQLLLRLSAEQPLTPNKEVASLCRLLPKF